MNKILSISIAAYNVENYLDQTLSSLNDQRFSDDIEVLIIDDGSKDGTKDIALKYQNMAHGTFKYIQKENGGHGSTINKGLELATGKYFRVIDGDDWVNSDNFYNYIEKLKLSNADLVITPYYENRAGKEKIAHRNTNLVEGRKYSMSDVEDIEIWLPTITIKTELLKQSNMHITENCYYVDIEYVLWCICLSKKFQYFEIPTYVYRLSNISQSTSKKNMLNNIKMQEKVANNVVNLYNRLALKNSLPEKHCRIAFKPVKQSVGGLYRTYLLMNTAKESKVRIVEFDQRISAISQAIFEKLSDNIFFKIIRLNRYTYIPWLRILYRIWILKY